MAASIAVSPNGVKVLRECRLCPCGHSCYTDLDAELLGNEKPLIERFRRRKRPLRALQVEVTSRCTRRCAICPRSVLSDTWCEGDLEDAVWKRLEPDLTLAKHVHLQGWGELSFVGIRPHADHTQKSLLRGEREGNRGHHFGEVRPVSLTR